VCAPTYTGADASRIGDRTIVGVGPGKEDTGMGRDGFAATLAAQLQAEGGNSSGGAPADAAELAHAQPVGSEGYVATKDMSAGPRAAYWTAQQTALATGTDGSQATTTSSRNKTGREREDAMGCGGPSIASEVANDGRTQQQGSGGTALVTRNKAGGAERVKGQGKLNRDGMLRIKQLVNPGAR
jgi:hypothetical protein